MQPGVTVKFDELVAVPPSVVIAILPVMAPVGTVAFTCVADLVKFVAATPPKVTSVVCVSPVPVITTCVPTVPLDGLKLEMVGMTLKVLLLASVPDGVVTVTNPVVPVAGTSAVR